MGLALMEEDRKSNRKNKMSRSDGMKEREREGEGRIKRREEKRREK